MPAKGKQATSQPFPEIYIFKLHAPEIRHAVRRGIMKKNLLFSLLLLSTAFLYAGGQQESTGPVSDSSEAVKTLTIYCYDSFASEWGPGPALASQFTEETGIQVKLVAPGDAVTILSKVIMEKEAPRADLLIGPDNNLLARTLAEDVLVPYNAPALASIPEELKFDDSNHLLPFDWGYFAICYDSEVIDTPPASLEDLTKPEFAKSLVLMDPRTSSPGMGFLLWTRAVYGDDYLAYWNRLSASVLSVTESWSNGYGLFTSGEAPLVLSYSTSPVYHKMWKKLRDIKPSPFLKVIIFRLKGLV